MRATSIEFKGYQRLAATKCNTEGKMIAFLGPNEAGKTTLLRALDWFSHADGPLPESAKNKTDKPDNDTPVVRVVYWLEPDDLKALEVLRLANLPETLQVSRYGNGERKSRTDPEVYRDPAPFELAAMLLADVESRYADEFERDAEDVDEENPATISAWVATVRPAITSHDGGRWQAAWDEHVDSFLGFLREPPPAADKEESTDTPRAEEAADAIEEVRRILRLGSAEHAIREVLLARVPEFALFSEEDRNLKSAYDLSDEGFRSSPAPALDHLAWVADLNLNDLWLANESGDVRGARTIERRANEQLKARLGPRWSQKDLDVQFNMDGSNLEVLVYENDEDGADTPIEERSEGLRIFVSLVAFLARHDFAEPPILLVDEAETHLHYDAQADLIEVLTNDVHANQVFYTTHSPGCLPRDLGTGVRLVAPMEGRSDASALRNDFWTSNEPGFTPLLFAMGAGAAAFSAFRRAVMAEGASDMILLPSLLRLATGRSELDFQVAPGLANYSGTGLELEETAARVVYLLDGDQGGDDKKKYLVDDLGVDESRVKQFPVGTALEDYVDLDLYLGLINALLKLQEPGELVTVDDLMRDVPISKAIELWCDARDLKAPGKPLVASQLVGAPLDLKLASGAKDVLKGLHADIAKTLGQKMGKGRGR